MIPIFADANHPTRYSHLVDEVDIIYQDIAQRNQAEIALANVEYFLKDDGYLILMIYHSVSVIWNFFGDVCDLHKHSPKTFPSSIHYTHAPEVTKN